MNGEMRLVEFGQYAQRGISFLPAVIVLPWLNVAYSALRPFLSGSSRKLLPWNERGTRVLPLLESTSVRRGRGAARRQFLRIVAAGRVPQYIVATPSIVDTLAAVVLGRLPPRSEWHDFRPLPISRLGCVAVHRRILSDQPCSRLSLQSASRETPWS